ncbi:hypothetical protein AVEN_58980-1 [Araneus ventricosus]|uniref:Uncharacterized protein n=1 Tax=Araneus ventricosus TaxID=182803 RepID=A0A4Y2UZ38_ARAVE|nr:hypothetical protein AVEN_58980-1 [Araneus ventricosus]
MKRTSTKQQTSSKIALLKPVTNPTALRIKIYLQLQTGILQIEKNRLKALRRRAQTAPQDQRNARFHFHKEELKKYMRKVKTAKNSGWKSFYTIASNPYGTHYKAAFRKAIKPTELIALNNHDPSGNHLKIA